MNAAMPDIYFLEIHPDGISSWGNLTLPEKKGPVEYQKFAAGEPEFWENLQKNLENGQNSAKNDVLFFIHGMNGDREPYFSQVLRQMQSDYLAREDCSIRSIVCLIWKPERRGYKTISREAAPLIAAVFSTIFPRIKIFEEITAKSVNTKFHLFGNSMAARIFSLAFQKIDVANFEKPIFSTMIFAAPDVEKADFPDRPGFQKMPKISAKTIFFFNKKDNALRYAAWFNGPMLGREGPEMGIEIPENIEFLEIKDITNRTIGAKITQHTYYSFSPEVVEKVRNFWKI